MKDVVAINLVPVVSGGGLQNALSFINELVTLDLDFDYFFIIRGGGLLESLLKKLSLNYESVGHGVLSRIIFEFHTYKKLESKYSCKAVFTLFGSPPVVSKGVRISGFARSNIVEKDDFFWSFLPFHKRLSKKFQDYLIKILCRRAKVIILETDRLKRLACSNEVFKKSIIHVVKMAPSSIVVENLKKVPPVCVNDLECFDLLYLTGSHPNKNIHRLAVFVRNFVRDNFIKLRIFVTCVDDEYFQFCQNEFNKYGVPESLINLGPVPQDKIKDVIASCHAMINVARLESFSNNWVEAWASKRLLICLNSPYSKESCGDAAVYIDFEANNFHLKEVLTEQSVYDGYIHNGQKMLSRHPSPREKVLSYVEIIKSNL